MVAETEGAPQSLRDAITEAVEGSDYVKTLQEEQDDLGDVFPRDPSEGPTAEETELATGDGTEPAAEAEVAEGDETPPEDDTAWDELTSYWGTSLEGFSVAQKKQIVSALEQRDTTISKLQQRLAQEPKAPEAVETAPDPELTDDDVLRAIGLDPETADEFEIQQARKFSLPLAKQLMQLEEVVENLQTTQQTQEVANQWNASLNDLEDKYGKLPGDRVQVLTYAVEEGISDPELLYFRLTRDGRKAVDAEVAKVRQTEARRAQQGGVKPTTRGSDGKRVLNTEGKSLRDTVREAALLAQEETGHRWSDVLRRR